MTDANREKLAALAKRQDKRGHIALESHEMPFVLVDDGSRWLNVVDAERMIYELNDSGWQLLDELPPDR